MNKVLCRVYDIRVLQGCVAFKQKHYNVCDVKVLAVCFKYKEEEYRTVKYIQCLGALISALQVFNVQHRGMLQC